MDKVFFDEVTKEITIQEYFSEEVKLNIYLNGLGDVTFECVNNKTASLNKDNMDLLIKYLEVIKNGN